MGVDDFRLRVIIVHARTVIDIRAGACCIIGLIIQQRTVDEFEVSGVFIINCAAVIISAVAPEQAADKGCPRIFIINRTPLIISLIAFKSAAYKPGRGILIINRTPVITGHWRKGTNIIGAVDTHIKTTD